MIQAPNSNLGRAMFVWDRQGVNTPVLRRELVEFCVGNGITVLFLHAYPWLGPTAGDGASIRELRLLVKACRDLGIVVWALGGDTGWAINQPWVYANFLSRIVAYNSSATEAQMVGVMYDVEYWTVPAYLPATHVPALCSLLTRTRRMGLQAGLFVARFLLDTSRTKITYGGVSAVDGVHLINVSDHIVVGSYSNLANTLGGQVGQIPMMANWLSTAAGKCLVWSGSETIDTTPAWITYYGQTRASMEAQHLLVSNSCNLTNGSAFAGQAIHSYESYKLMP